MNILQMMMQQKMNQIPQKMMSQMEQQLKRANPQAFKEFQQARSNNVNPEEYLNKITNSFSPERKQQWDSIISGINAK